MPHGRFFLIATLGAVLVGLALARGIEPALDPLIEKAPSIETVLRYSPPLRSGRESDPSLTAKRTKPGIAAFLEVEDGLFQILVGRDREGEAWSAAVSGGE
jgi:hypothetical protein